MWSVSETPFQTVLNLRSVIKIRVKKNESYEHGIHIKDVPFGRLFPTWVLLAEEFI